MKLSKTQRHAVELMREFGRLERYAGGFWGEPGFRNGDHPAEHVGTPTVQNLYNRFLVDVICIDGSWQWDGHSVPRFAVPTEKLIHFATGRGA